MAPVTIELQRGDLLQLSADVCVLSVHRSRDMKTFKLSNHVLEVCGDQVQHELRQSEAQEQELKNGEVTQTSAGNLENKFKALFLICLHKWKPENKEVLLQSILECLELSCILGHKTIAFPALGMGGLKYPPHVVAQCLIQAVALHNLQYSKRSDKTSEATKASAAESYTHSALETVYIVLQDGETEAIKAFLQICASRSTGLSARQWQTADATTSSSQGQNHNRRWQQRNLSSSSPSGASPSRDALSLWSGATALVNSLLPNYSAGPFHFTVATSANQGKVGLCLNANVDILFFTSFIPKGLMPFWQMLTQ